MIEPPSPQFGGFPSLPPWLRPPARQAVALTSRAFGGNKVIDRGTGNVVDLGISKHRRTRVAITGDGNRVQFGNDGLFDRLHVVITGTGCRVEVGDGCRIAGSALILDGDGCTVRIGAGTTIEAGSHIAAVERAATVVIGDDCMFSGNVDLRTTDSHAILDGGSGSRLNPAEDVVIGRHVWLGTQTLILKGSQIGENTVVGARSMVRGTVPSGVVVVGNDARIIRQNVTWSRAR